MSQLEEGPESYDLDDRCVVPWNDGSIYAGRVQKILDPERQVVIQGVPTRKGGKSTMIEDTTPFEKLKNDRHQRIPPSVMNSSLNSKEKWFYVHYFGWKTNYDEWLPLQRMLPHTPRNINEMKRVNAEIKERERLKKEEELRQKNNRKRPAPPSKASTSTETESPDSAKQNSSQPQPSKRRNTGTPAEPPTREASPAASTLPKRNRRRVVLSDGPGYEIRLSVPLELKRLLVKDWQLVTRDREIVCLPRPVCVVEILRDFSNATVPNKNSGDYENMEQFVESMETYFDYAFGMMLLYRFERNQYYTQKHNNPDFRPSLVYGAEHLARLIVSMPSLLSQLASMDDITMEYVVGQLEKLASFMSEHRVRYFAGEKSYDSVTRIYETASVPNLAAEPPVPPRSEERAKSESVGANEDAEND